MNTTVVRILGLNMVAMVVGTVKSATPAYQITLTKGHHKDHR